MLPVAFRVIAPEKVKRLRSWLAEATKREGEVKETFLRETVRHEQAYLIERAGEHILVYLMEVEDPLAARTAYKESTYSIDLEHRKVMADVVQENLEPELLFDVRL